MSTYFIDPYKKYYEKLSSHTGIVEESKTLNSSIKTSVQTITTLNSNLKSALWQELGYQELITVSFPGLASNIETLQDNITDGLQAACTIAINELLPIVTELKTEDEAYENTKTSLDNLVVVPEYDSEGNQTIEYQRYLEQKNKLEKELEEHKTQCIKLQTEAKKAADSIKALDGSIEKTNLNTQTVESSQTIYEISGDNNENLVAVSYDGIEYYVVNTKISVIDYANYVQKNGMYQNAGALGGQCMIASQIYARDLLRGTYSSKEDFINMKGSPATRINEKVRSQSKDEVLSYVYNEIQEGHPVVLQVTQKRSNEGLRHLVTVVGFKENVTSYSQLTSENILVLDNVDGKIQTLSEKNRDLYNQGGNGYYALGPTENFLAKEVYNITYSNA